ncbi:MAG: pal [Bacteriovoracaceae bacterium]|nr:pal [Bacteriovoracaceae bacterium]
MFPKIFSLTSIAFLISICTFGETIDQRTGRPYLFLGFDAGYARVNTSILTEFDKNGYELNAKGLGSYYWPKWVVDGGLGWTYNVLNGANPPVAKEEITTKALFAEFSGRYRFTSDWQGGIISRAVFGTELNFGSELDKKNLGLFAGLQAAYEIPLKKLLLRFTAQALSDLNIPNRHMYLAEGGIQIGFAPTLHIPSKDENTPTKSDEQNKSVRFDLEGGTFYFDFASSHLNPDAERFLIRVGKFLKSHSDLWDHLEIGGHTDERGPDDYNFVLSKSRALAVQDALITGGAPYDRISTLGYSSHNPRAHGKTESAYRANRRVEMKFTGISNPSKFKEALQKIKDEQ